MQRRIYTILGGVLLCGLIGLTCASPAEAQDVQGSITKAEKTLTEIRNLLDAIAARQAAGGQGGAQPVHTDNGGANAVPTGGMSLFDGASMTGWKRTEFVNARQVRVEKAFRGGPAALVVEAGDPLNGLTWTRPADSLPRTNYEITLEAMKIAGDDFMCGLTFPVGETYATLVLGGWGGSMVGISSIDGMDASENETSKIMHFPKDHWFAIRMRVTPDKLETWLDGKKIIDANIKGKRIGLRFGEISKSVPLGFATYQTSAAFRAIKLVRLDAK